MTNINCSSDCIHQKDGKCRLETVAAMAITLSNNCAYYTKEKKEEAKTKST